MWVRIQALLDTVLRPPQNLKWEGQEWVELALGVYDSTHSSENDGSDIWERDEVVRLMA